MKQLVLVFVALVALAGCSNWVYKYDIVQGNFLNQDDVDKLRIQMTREQVEYVLGAPVVENPFNADQWHYVHTVKSGKTNKTQRKELIVRFDNDLLVDVQGDFEPPKDFNTPLEQ